MRSVVPVLPSKLLLIKPNVTSLYNTDQDAIGPRECFFCRLPTTLKPVLHILGVWLLCHPFLVAISEYIIMSKLNFCKREPHSFFGLQQQM